jgi:hypothetical protein
VLNTTGSLMSSREIGHLKSGGTAAPTTKSIDNPPPTMLKFYSQPKKKKKKQKQKMKNPKYLLLQLL